MPTRSLSTVGVVIPALNEREPLAKLLPILRDLQPGQVIIADNGSTDGTGDLARAFNQPGTFHVTVVRETQRGYGAACQAGISALHDTIEVVVFLDADMADDPTRMPDLVAPILDDQADLVIGTRSPHLREPGAMTLPQRFGDWLATRLIRLGWGYDYGDLGPFRAIRRRDLDRIAMQDRAFGWTIEMQIRAVEEGLRIVQRPVAYRRRTGQSKISGTVRGVALAAYWILSTWWRLWRTRHRRLLRRSPR